MFVCLEFCFVSYVIESGFDYYFRFCVDFVYAQCIDNIGTFLRVKYVFLCIDGILNITKNNISLIDIFTLRSSGHIYSIVFRKQQ